MATENFGYDLEAEQETKIRPVVNNFTQASSYLSLNINGVDLHLSIEDSTKDLDEKLITTFNKIAEILATQR